jgi:hypothetical protein
VVVAIIQISTLNTEVDKGSKTTGLDFGLVDPKAQGNSVNWGRPQGRTVFGASQGRKGIALKFVDWALLIGRKALTSRS